MRCGFVLRIRKLRQPCWMSIAGAAPATLEHTPNSSNVCLQQHKQPQQGLKFSADLDIRRTVAFELFHSGKQLWGQWITHIRQHPYGSNCRSEEGLHSRFRHASPFPRTITNDRPAVSTSHPLSSLIPDYGDKQPPSSAQAWYPLRAAATSSPHVRGRRSPCSSMPVTASNFSRL